MEKKAEKKSPPISPEEEERLRYFMSLSVEEKLHHLEELNAFFNKMMPAKNKEIAQQLRDMGF